MSSYGVWWIEIVLVVVGAMCLASAIRETAAFIKVARIRQRDGGTLIPRTKEEYLLLFPGACARCLSRRGRRVKGWRTDAYGASEFVETWQCAECADAGADNGLQAMHDTEITQPSVRARPRWFISAAEADRIERPRER